MPGSSDTVSLPALIRSGFLPRLRVGADAEHAVLGVEHDRDPLRHVVGGERRHPDAEVDVVSVLHLQRRAPDDANPLGVCLGLAGPPERAPLDALLVGLALEQALDEDVRHVDGVGVDQPVTDTCSAFGLSRPVFYKSRQALAKEGLPGLASPSPHGPSASWSPGPGTPP